MAAYLVEKSLNILKYKKHINTGNSKNTSVIPLEEEESDRYTQIKVTVTIILMLTLHYLPPLPGPFWQVQAADGTREDRTVPWPVARAQCSAGCNRRLQITITPEIQKNTKKHRKTRKNTKT